MLIIVTGMTYLPSGCYASLFHAEPEKACTCRRFPSCNCQEHRLEESSPPRFKISTGFSACARLLPDTDLVLISLKGTTIATSSGNSGHYLLEHLPEGTFVLQVSGIGWKTASREVTIKEGNTLEINFEMEEDNVQLDGVVVSANRSEIARMMAPTLVNVVNMDTYEKVNATALSQGLVFQPGVRVENNCQNCSYQQVWINGLEGPYTQILIDSRPALSCS